MPNEETFQTSSLFLYTAHEIGHSSSIHLRGNILVTTYNHSKEEGSVFQESYYWNETCRPKLKTHIPQFIEALFPRDKAPPICKTKLNVPFITQNSLAMAKLKPEKNVTPQDKRKFFNQHSVNS